MLEDMLSPTIKVIVVAFCFLNAFIAKDGFARDRRDQIILIIAMGLTLAADIFMVLLHMNIIGIIFFCIVQSVHNYRYTNLSRVITQVIFGAVTFVVAALTGTELIFALGLSYAVFLLFSVTGSFMAYNKYPSPNNLMIVLGMLAFMGCDIFVGLQNLPVAALREPGTQEFLQRGIWFFYFPSQALLSSSARKNKNYKDEDDKQLLNR